MIDLHCHSHFSDGALSPDTLVEKALAAGITTLALTDHDTVAGLESLHKAAKTFDIKIINGIELSTRWKKHDIHILGLNISPKNRALNELISKQNQSRITRAKQIAECLIPLGVERAYDKACEIAGHDRVGRPHFAALLIKEKLVTDMQSAFKRYLGRGRLAYVPTPWISIDEAVEGIIEAGGHAVIAHPLKYALTRTKLHELIITFKSAGGQGMEVVSGEMMVSEITELAGFCTRYDLLASTGSDFHADGISRVNLGQQKKLPANCIPIWNQWAN